MKTLFKMTPCKLFVLLCATLTVSGCKCPCSSSDQTGTYTLNNLEKTCSCFGDKIAVQSFKDHSVEECVIPDSLNGFVIKKTASDGDFVRDYHVTNDDCSLILRVYYLDHGVRQMTALHTLGNSGSFDELLDKLDSDLNGTLIENEIVTRGELRELVSQQQ